MFRSCIRTRAASYEVNRLDSGVASVQIQAVDIILELAPADGIRGDKQSPDPEQDIGIKADTGFNGRARVGDGAFKLKPGLAFHPGYATNGLFVVNYTNPSGDTRVSAFRVSANPDLADAGSTLWQTVWERLPATFPASAFLSSLTFLNLREAELFTDGREVARAIIPFLTRLGLPILYDARHVVHAVRQLVNAGLAWVQDPEDNWRVYKGPHEPLPAEISDERLAMMVR